jgi:hypothetical protein
LVYRHVFEVMSSDSYPGGCRSATRLGERRAGVEVEEAMADGRRRAPVIAARCRPPIGVIVDDAIRLIGE